MQKRDSTPVNFKESQVAEQMFAALLAKMNWESMSTIQRDAFLGRLTPEERNIIKRVVALNPKPSAAVSSEIEAIEKKYIAELNRDGWQNMTTEQKEAELAHYPEDTRHYLKHIMHMD